MKQHGLFDRPGYVDKRPRPIDQFTFHEPALLADRPGDYWRLVAIETDCHARFVPPLTLTLQVYWVSDAGLLETRGFGGLHTLWHYDLPKRGAPRFLASTFELSGRLLRHGGRELSAWLSTHAKTTWAAWRKRHPDEVWP